MLGSGYVEDALTILVESGQVEDEARWHLQVALCRMELGEFDGALEGLQGCAGTFPEIEEYRYLWIAECLEALGFSARARSWYERLYTSFPEGPAADSARLRIAELHRQAGDHVAARAMYERLLDGGANDDLIVDALFGQMGVTLDLDPRMARRTALRLMTSYPENPRAREAADLLGSNLSAKERHVVAKVYLHHWEYDLAIRELQEVIRRDRTLAAEAQYLIGKAYFGERKFTEAAEAFKRAYDTYRYRSALYYLARCEDGRDRDRQARAIYERFASRYPNHILTDDALWCAAWSYEREGAFDAARGTYLRLSRKYRKSEYADRAVWRAGFVLYRAGKYEEALQAFEELSTNASASYIRDQSLFWGGKCLERMDDSARAKTWFQRASLGFPSSYYSTRARGVLSASHTGQEPLSSGAREKERAPRSGERSYVSSQTPDDRDPRLERAYLLASLGMRRAAERELIWAERTGSRDPDTLRELRTAYDAIGAWYRALKISVRLRTSKEMAESALALREVYPEYYWEEVARSARRNDVDPYLLLAIIRQESFFNPEAQARAGERGLMQVLPSTGRVLAQRAAMEDFVLDDLYRPDVCIRLGSRFLADRIDAFRSRFEDGARIPLAIAAYNAGPGAVERWIHRLPMEDMDVFMESIPYGGTRQYVKLVLRNYRIYEYLYRAE